MSPTQILFGRILCHQQQLFSYGVIAEKVILGNDLIALLPANCRVVSITDPDTNKIGEVMGLPIYPHPSPQYFSIE